MVALQTGVVDGAENNPPTLLAQNHYTVTKVMSLTGHLIIPEIFVFSKKSWEGLSKDDQALVRKFSAEAQIEQRKLWDDYTREAETKLKGLGVQLILSKAALREAVAKIAADPDPFAAPRDYDPVDATQLPDGRVLILLRRVAYALPARFDTAIAIADPRRIRAGQPWQARIIQRLTGGVFADNFEGLAYVPSASDPARGSLWLIADDNFSVFQRNMLVRFDWEG